MTINSQKQRDKNALASVIITHPTDTTTRVTRKNDGLRIMRMPDLEKANEKRSQGMGRGQALDESMIKFENKFMHHDWAFPGNSVETYTGNPFGIRAGFSGDLMHGLTPPTRKDIEERSRIQDEKQGSKARSTKIDNYYRRRFKESGKKDPLNR